MDKAFENTKEYYENLLKDIKEEASKIYNKISSKEENSIADDIKFINNSIKTVEDLLKRSNVKDEDFLLELKSYLDRIKSLLEHYNDDPSDTNKKHGLLHNYKYRILRGLLELEYEIGTI